MPCDIKLNKNYKIIELTYYGIITPKELKDAFDAAVSLSMKEGSTLFLADCTEMVGGHSVIDLYALISIFESSGLGRGMKEALLLPSLKSSINDVKFYETACLNRGFNVKIFQNVDDALKWLSN